MASNARPTETCRAGLRSAVTTTAEDSCPRCGGTMLWTKASWHCPDCRYKQGCC